jgi:hypothetical protein
MAFAYLYWGKIGTLKRRMRADHEQIMVLKQFLDEMEQGHGKKRGVEALLLELQDERVLWNGKLLELSQMIPNEIHLTYLGLEVVERTPDPLKPRQKVEETVLTMKGEIPAKSGEESLDHIARLIMKLNDSPAFSDDFEPMALVYTELVKSRAREFMEFELSGRLRAASAKG